MTAIRITNLDSEKIGANLWRLNKPLIYALSNGEITVRTNFITDGASRPQSFGSLCNRMSGPEAEAAVLHDWLYSKDSGPGLRRVQADELFYDAMIAGGVGTLRAKTIYMGVRIGGRSSWKSRYSVDKLQEN